MKKFMLRGYEKEAISEHLPKSLKYNTWYHFVSPFDWTAFKLKRNSRYVHFYNDINDTTPIRTVSRKKFLRDGISFSKGDFDEVFEDTELGRYERKHVDRAYRKNMR